MSIAEAIHEAKSVFAAAKLDCGDALLPPANDSSIDKIATDLSLSVPKELRNLYRIHGGQEYVSPGNSGLFGLYRLLTPAEIISEYLMITETSGDDPIMFEWKSEDEPPYWDKELLPFALWDATSLCIHSRLGDVWQFRPYGGLTTHWPNLESVLREVIDGVHVAAAEKPSWKKHLPTDATEVCEWCLVEGFLPTSCWYQLKARVSVGPFQEFVRQLGLIPKAEHGDPEAPDRNDLWNAAVDFEGDWWDPSPNITKTFFSAGEIPSICAKYENGFLYFKLWQPMTGTAE